ncbi:MAG: Sec-independent protein translocase protein TatB [Methylococcaceae bacterium]
MFDVGFSEILMIGLVSLLVIGPERLPKAARFVGFWLGKARAVMNNAKAEFEQELQLEEMRQLFNQQSGINELQQVSNELSNAHHDIQQSLSANSLQAHTEELETLTPTPIINLSKTASHE